MSFNRLAALAVALLLVPVAALAQTAGSFPYGSPLGSAALNQALALKQDYVGTSGSGALARVTGSAISLSAATGLPLTTGVTGVLPAANGGTGISSFGAGVATWLGTPTSANLLAAVTDETGSGALVFGTAPTITLPNATGLPISTGVSGLATGIATFLGTPSSANLGAALTDKTGTGVNVFANGPTLIAPVLGAATGTSLILSASAQVGTNLWLSSNSAQLQIGGAADLILTRDAANALALRNGVNGQTFNFYNTYTDASNYERGIFSWVGNTLFIGTQQAGTGSARALQFYVGGTSVANFATSGHLLWNTDNTFDIGATGANRPRNGFFANTLSVGSCTIGVNTICGNGPISGGVLLTSLSSPANVGSAGATDFGKLGIPAYTNLDASGAGTAAYWTSELFGVPTLTSTNPRTYSQASTLTIVGPPIASTNVTITQPLGLNLISGSALFGGGTILLSGGGSVSTTGAAMRVQNDAGVFSLGAASDTTLSRAAAANWRFGPADAAAPVAQTDSVQNVVAGTSNTAGANRIFAGSQGTGTGAGGNILFQVAPAGTTGSAQNALTTALTIDAAGGLTSAGTILGGGNIATTSSAGAISLRNFGSSLTSPANNVWQVGIADAAAPAAQTVQATSVVAGTTNTNGAIFTIAGSKGTGTGTGGQINFQVALPGSTGSAQNALVSTWQISGTTGNLNAATDNTFDIGGTGANRPRNVNIAGTFTGPYVKTTLTIVGSLGTCSGNGGLRSFVTDATVAASTNFGIAVTGGGANSVPVYCDGASWKIGQNDLIPANDNFGAGDFAEVAFG